MSNCYVKVCGGLGNQLFQIAAAYAYCKKYNKQLILDGNDWSASQGISPLIYQQSIFKNFKFGNCPTDVTNIDEQMFNYHDIDYHETDVCIHGYRQSLKYFENVKDEFLSLLDLPKVNSSFITPDIVVFHIRRGDYLRYKYIHHVCDTEYFLNMFELFKDKQIHVFTDSPEYVLQEFPDMNFKLIQTSSELNDLTLMSKYSIIVCSNSSFSWWASLIGNFEKVIVPDRWFVRKEKEYEDIFRPDMIRITV